MLKDLLEIFGELFEIIWSVVRIPVALAIVALIIAALVPAIKSASKRTRYVQGLSVKYDRYSPKELELVLSTLESKKAIILRQKEIETMLMDDISSRKRRELERDSVFLPGITDVYIAKERIDVKPEYINEDIRYVKALVKRT